MLVARHQSVKRGCLDSTRAAYTRAFSDRDTGTEPRPSAILAHGGRSMPKIARTIRGLCLSVASVVLVGSSLAHFSVSQHPGSSERSIVSPVIVIGFLGGFVRHDDAVHSGVQLAARLQRDYPSGVYIETFENRRGDEAYQRILKLLDANSDGQVSNQEKQDARIIIYGISWGASQTVTLARELQAEHIPVLLTIQVDSITKAGQNDKSIPSNVEEAVNFYQSDGILHGRAEIEAEDPAHTHILGNYRFEYRSHPIECGGYPWYDSVFTKQHTEIECDPAVWGRVESLIRAKLPPVPQATSSDRKH
jgi:hypothetical protein